mmetsp:Transcript_3994/g.8901  ORF Transcript_3994/g.8901 Transcript_3994/m.8901 type:complete len:271 (+) Transcript_3994:681-1493(+)
MVLDNGRVGSVGYVDRTPMVLALFPPRCDLSPISHNLENGRDLAVPAERFSVVVWLRAGQADPPIRIPQDRHVVENFPADGKVGKNPDPGCGELPATQVPEVIGALVSLVVGGSLEGVDHEVQPRDVAHPTPQIAFGRRSIDVERNVKPIGLFRVVGFDDLVAGTAAEIVQQKVSKGMLEICRGAIDASRITTLQLGAVVKDLFLVDVDLGMLGLSRKRAGIIIGFRVVRRSCGCNNGRYRTKNRQSKKITRRWRCGGFPFPMTEQPDNC